MINVIESNEVREKKTHPTLTYTPTLTRILLILGGSYSVGFTNLWERVLGLPQDELGPYRNRTFVDEERRELDLGLILDVSELSVREIIRAS